MNPLWSWIHWFHWWSEWSWITDSDSHHLKGMHPKSSTLTYSNMFFFCWVYLRPFLSQEDLQRTSAYWRRSLCWCASHTCRCTWWNLCTEGCDYHGFYKVIIFIVKRSEYTKASTEDVDLCQCNVKFSNLTLKEICNKHLGELIFLAK